MGTVEVGSDPAGTSSVSLGDNQQLKINDLVYRYGSGLALNGVNLSISSGEFVSVLGPSGCGKTTLLRLIAGFLHPTSGAILLNGIDMSERPPEKRPLNMVFQHLALFPHLSVEENIGFSLSIQRRPKTEIRRRVADMLSLVGLSGYESRSISQLSGGQQQRVAIARAVVTEPSILLLDEPLGALDLALRKEMQTELKALQRRLGITFLFVTHDQTEAMMMSDRIVLMREGRIVQDAEPRETYDHPVNTFAATFVGDTNLFVGTIESVDGTRIVLAADGLRLVADTPGSEWHVGANTAASIRPERLVMLEHSHDPLDIPGEIEFISFLGPEVVFDVRTIAGLIKVREGAASSTTERSVGQSVHLRYAPSHVRAFSIDEAGAT